MHAVIMTQSRSATSKFYTNVSNQDTLTKVMDECLEFSLNDKFSYHQASAEFVYTHLIVVFIVFCLVTDKLNVPGQSLTETNGQSRIHETSLCLSNDLKLFRFHSGRWKKGIFNS